MAGGLRAAVGAVGAALHRHSQRHRDGRLSGDGRDGGGASPAGAAADGARRAVRGRSPGQRLQGLRDAVDGGRTAAAARPDAQVCCLGIGRPPRLRLPQDGRLRCLPFVTERETLADYYRAADVFWHAANAEAFGKTVAEAMACGTPVIATPVGGITDQLREGENGFAATPHDPDAFVGRTLELLALSPEMRQRLRWGAAQMGQGFSLERQADRFLKLYGELIEVH